LGALGCSQKSTARLRNAPARSALMRLCLVASPCTITFKESEMFAQTAPAVSRNLRKREQKFALTVCSYWQPYVRFKAGKMTVEPKAGGGSFTVTPTAGKGEITLSKGEDQLIHFQWKERPGGKLVDVRIIVLCGITSDSCSPAVLVSGRYDLPFIC
jgi:hypothetical protein